MYNISFSAIQSISPLVGGFEIDHIDDEHVGPAYWCMVIDTETTQLCSIAHRMSCEACGDRPVMEVPGLNSAASFHGYEDWVLESRWENEGDTESEEGEMEVEKESESDDEDVVMGGC